MPFEFEPTPLQGLIVIKPRVFTDDRGFFMESYKESEFSAAGIKEKFVQDNHSYSQKNIIRGLHFQREPHGQGKLVRCIAGRVWDAVVDLRANSPTYTQWYGTELSSQNKTMLYIPPGFAHGFAVLSDTAEFVYKVTAEYAPASDGGILWNDPEIGIGWPLNYRDALVSEKDQELPLLKEIEVPFI
ncbi:MAG: dTDP-4-dehydrorhamnose 3,5-epimerase [Spirochaetaceae bacterium]|nr:dTDP-4-dehydrorhamnose 3,5-epimerase [Spirochaetaceae bacterium]MCF7938743.1 dTDP-4-dehydrorhamnose 3,5-epimerase [Spirochaetales bacterium]